MKVNHTYEDETEMSQFDDQMCTVRHATFKLKNCSQQCGSNVTDKGMLFSSITVSQETFCQRGPLKSSSSEYGNILYQYQPDNLDLLASLTIEGAPVVQSGNKRRQRHDPVATDESLRGNCKYDEVKLFLVVPEGTARDSGHNLLFVMFWLSLRRRLFTRRLGQDWGNLPREVAEGLVWSWNYGDFAGQKRDWPDLKLVTVLPQEGDWTRCPPQACTILYL